MAQSSNEKQRANSARVSKDNRALRPNGSTDAKNCFSWITRSGKKLQVFTPEPLIRVASYKFLNFTTILGPARQGKSFLMNCLLGDSVFDTANTMGVCTKGVQVASVVHKVRNGGCAFFVDTEGQGDEDVDSDATLLTPILLLSKVILFNWKGGLQKHQILNELAILVEVGNCVSSNSLEDDRPKFGHLHIVLRDFHFEGTAKEAFAIIFDEENKRGENVKERNKVRKKLRSSFESIDVSIFPMPSQEVDRVDLDSTSAKFQESVEKLRDAILDQMSRPRCLGTINVNSQNVDVLVRLFAEELERSDIVHVKSVVSQLQRGIVDEAKRCFQETLIKAYKDIHIPVRDGLEQMLIQRRDTLFNVFGKSTAKIDLEAVYKDEVLENLEHFADRELDVKRKENLLVIQSREAKQKAILVRAAEKFRSAVESELRKGGKKSRQMQELFRELQKRLINNFLEETSKLDWTPELEKKEELEKLKQWTSVRLKEKIEAKEKEENAEISEQQNRLSRAAEDFKLGVESELKRSKGASTSSLRQTFELEKERLLKIFRNSTDSLHQISQLKDKELDKLKNWAVKKLDEKVEDTERAERLQERERKIEREQDWSKVQRELQLLQTPFVAPQLPSNPFSSSSALAGPGYFNQTPYPYLNDYSPATPLPNFQHSYSPAARPAPQQRYCNNTSSSGKKFYKGGQFTPGGGRARKGGEWHIPNLP